MYLESTPTSQVKLEVFLSLRSKNHPTMRSSSLSMAAAFSSISLAATVRTIHQFPNPTWVKSIASTRDASLLVGS
jgi:hypothetical protein